MTGKPAGNSPTVDISEKDSLQIWALSDPETYSYANDAHASFLGKPVEAFPASSLQDVWGVSPETDLRLERNRMLFEGTDSLQTREWVPDHRGEVHHLHVTRARLPSGDGGGCTVVCTAYPCRDVPETGQVSWNEGEVFRVLSAQSSDGIYIYSGSTFDFVNDRLCRMLGYSKEVLLKLRVKSLIYPDDRERVNRYGRARSENGYPPWRYRARVVTSSGDVRHFAFEVAPVRSGSRICTVGTVRDVTGQSALQSGDPDRYESNQDKLLSVGELAGGIAHDFNNLLTGILGNIQLARKECDPEAAEHLDRACEICSRATGLTGQLLALSSGGEPIRRPISISESLRLEVEDCLTRDDIELEFQVPEGVMAIMADRNQFNQVIRNIVVNSEQAMPDGGKITVTVANIDSDEIPIGLQHREGGYVQVAFEDTGTGIDEGNLSRVFDPFFTTTSERPGAGLGLAIVYAIVRKHEGYVTVESESGKGCCFRFYFPAVGICVYDSVFSEPEHTEPSVSILLMDDEDMILSVGSEMMEAAGFLVHAVSDGQAALDAYRARRDAGDPFDMVILDLTVPGGMGGEECLKLIREIDPEVRAVVSSGYSNSPVMSKYAKHGFSAVLTKPYTISDVRQTVCRLMRS